MYLDALNSLLISGEYPPLFSVDELDSLLQVRFSSDILPQSFWFFLMPLLSLFVKFACVKCLFYVLLTGFDASHQEEILQLFGGPHEIFHHSCEGQSSHHPLSSTHS